MSALMPGAFAGAIDYVVNLLICIYLQAKKDEGSQAKTKSDSARSYELAYNILQGFDVYSSVDCCGTFHVIQKVQDQANAVLIRWD